MLTSDPTLDGPALVWLVEYVAAAADGAIAPARLAEHVEGLAGGPVERRPKRLRLYLLGDTLLLLEAAGLTKAKAMVAAPYVARGLEVGRGRLKPLTEHERRGALKARKALDVAAADRDLRPLPLPQTPSPQEREAFVAGEREQHRSAAERRARFERRRELSRVPILVAGFDPRAVRAHVAAIFRGRPIPAEQAEMARELHVALARLQQLDRRRFDHLRALARTLRDPRGEARAAVADLIACTDAAHRDAETLLGVPVRPTLASRTTHARRSATVPSSPPVGAPARRRQTGATALEAAGTPLLPHFALPSVRGLHGPSRRPVEIGDAVGRLPALVIAADVLDDAA